MCVIIIGGKARPTRSILFQCEDSNRDGAGIAWVHTNGRVRFVKGLNARGVAEVLERIVPRGAEFVIHFRLATAGGSVPELTHPFVVSDRSELFLEGEVDRVLFHNGHEGRFEELRAEAAKRTGYCLQGPVSDSRVVARIAHLAGLDILDKMSGKYVILGGSGIEVMSPKMGMVLTGQTGYGAGTGWTQHAGLLFSNLHWKARTVWTTAGSKSAAYSFRGSRPDADTPAKADDLCVTNSELSRATSNAAAIGTLRSAQLELGWNPSEVIGDHGLDKDEADQVVLESELNRLLEREAEFEREVERARESAFDIDKAIAASEKGKSKSNRKPKRERVSKRVRTTKVDEPKWTYTPPSVARDMSVVPANPEKPRSLRQEK